MMRRNRRFPLAAAVSGFLLLSACTPPADSGGTSEAPELADLDAPTSDAQALMSYLDRRIRGAEDKFMQLAEAIPEEGYDWRPMEGVRSFREVFIHIAADNWAPVSIGVPAPEDIPVTNDSDSFAAYQAQHLTKEETLEEMRRSFEFLLGALEVTQDRLDEPVVFLGNEWIVGEMWVALVTHMHEHLGQSIAYARANEIVPPWSR